MEKQAKLEYGNGNYKLAVELYEKCLTEMELDAEIYLEYADALVKCGRLLDSLDVYSLCSRIALVNNDRLKNVVNTYMDMLTTTGLYSVKNTRRFSGLGCAICESILQHPVTLPCGHSFCMDCVVRDTSGVCRHCSCKIPARLETNVAVNNIVEKWFESEKIAAKLREEGNILCLQNRLEDAVAKYTAAIELAPSHLCYSNRSHTLYRLNRLQASLDDAEAAIRLRPHWVKGYYRRGVVMSAMGQLEEAFVAFSLCIALDNNKEAMKNDIMRLAEQLEQNQNYKLSLNTTRSYMHIATIKYNTVKLNKHKCLRRLLIPSSHGRRLCVKTRRNAPYFSPTHFFRTVNSSDCEENSSGEEDFQNQKKPSLPVQTNKRLHKLFDRVFHEIDRLKRTEKKTVNLRIDHKAIDPSDFDCVLCCRTLWKPVTTPCGHSYCSMCLDRCLDYSSACPLCMTTLSNYFGTSERRVTQFLEDALMIGLPGIYSSRLLLHRQELIDLEHSPEVPIFVCTTAFPSVPCPLFIYEPRYRLMVRRAVESGSRQFAIAACLQQGKSNKRYADYGTMLKIEDWVLLGDGCSILTTVGMRRFHVLSRGEKDGYDTAQVQFLSDTPIKEENLKEIQLLHNQVLNKGKRWFSKMLPAIQEEIWRTFGHMPEPEENWHTLTDGPSWLWWLLAILPLGKHLQVGLLSITCLAKRLHAVEKTLDHLAVNSESTQPLRAQTSSKEGSIPSAPS